jgi:hypothetical protein
MISMRITDLPAIYINLDRDHERRDSAELALKDLGFKNVIRSAGILADPYWVGCAAAHHAALCITEPPFIIFEDDIAVSKIYETITLPRDTDAVYLGVSKWARIDGFDSFLLRYRKETDQLYRIYNMLSTHAIMYVSQNYVDACKSIAKKCSDEYKTHWDQGLAEVQRFFQVYALEKPMVYQTSNELDTNAPLTTYFRYKNVSDIQNPTAFYHGTKFPSEAEPE